jgi:hypothetical protein
MLRPANCVDLRVCLRTWFCLRKQLYGFRKSSVLYQGTTLVVPHKIDNTSGFRGCVSTGREVAVLAERTAGPSTTLLRSSGRTILLRGKHVKLKLLRA